MRTLIGWDVSTSAIGICVRDLDTDRVLKLAVLFPKGETHAEKHIDAAKKVRSFMWELRESGVEKAIHIVEQCLAGFTGGMSSAQTKMALAAMNAVISFVLNDDWGRVIHILPVTTKAITKLKILPEDELSDQPKKAAVIRMARAALPDFPYTETLAGNWCKGVDDMADAWLLTVCGVMIVSGLAKLPEPKSKKKKKIGPESKVAGRVRKARTSKVRVASEG